MVNFFTGVVGMNQAAAPTVSLPRPTSVCVAAFQTGRPPWTPELQLLGRGLTSQ